MVRRIALATAISIAATVPVFAQQTGGRSVLAPRASCGTWSTAAQNDEAAQQALRLWVQGFLSGANITSTEEDFLFGVDPDTVTTWMNNYCQAHPLDGLMVAVVTLLREWRARGP